MTAPEKSERPTPAHDRLAELDAAVVEARRRVGAVERARREAKQEAARLKEEVTEAFAAGQDAEAVKLQKAREKAEAVAAGPWPERVAGTERAAARAVAERDAFIAANHGELVRERAAEARAVRDAVVESLRGFLTAYDAYNREAAHQVELLRPVPGIDGRAVPQLPDHLPFRVRDVQRAVDEGVPLPLPRDSVNASAFSLDPPPPGFEALAPSGNASARFVDQRAA